MSQNRDSFPGKFSYSAFSQELDLSPTRGLDEVISLTAEEMARASRLVTSAYHELLQGAAQFARPGLSPADDRMYRFTQKNLPGSLSDPSGSAGSFAEMVGLGFFNSRDNATDVFPANPLFTRDLVRQRRRATTTFTMLILAASPDGRLQCANGRSLHRELPADVRVAHQ